MLWSVAATWRMHALTENTEAIRKEAAQLHDRFGVFFGKFARVGEMSERLVRIYNEAVGSAESRLMPSLRRFRAMQGIESPEDTRDLRVEGTAKRPALPDLGGE